MSQDHNKESESEFARVVREGGDACNLSVAVTRAFGDVDSFRFRTYLLLLADYLALASYLHFFAFGNSLLLFVNTCVAVGRKSEASARCLQVGMMWCNLATICVEIIFASLHMIQVELSH